ncbi:hypothetical protein PENSPDRAFT_672494, partial [Peniophora sp. CONT]
MPPRARSKLYGSKPYGSKPYGGTPKDRLRRTGARHIVLKLKYCGEKGVDISVQQGMRSSPSISASAMFGDGLYNVQAYDKIVYSDSSSTGCLELWWMHLFHVTPLEHDLRAALTPALLDTNRILMKISYDIPGGWDYLDSRTRSEWSVRPRLAGCKHHGKEAARLDTLDTADGLPIPDVTHILLPVPEPSSEGLAVSSPPPRTSLDYFPPQHDLDTFVPRHDRLPFAFDPHVSPEALPMPSVSSTHLPVDGWPSTSSNVGTQSNHGDRQSQMRAAGPSSYIPVATIAGARSDLSVESWISVRPILLETVEPLFALAGTTCPTIVTADDMTSAIKTALQAVKSMLVDANAALAESHEELTLRRKKTDEEETETAKLRKMLGDVRAAATQALDQMKSLQSLLEEKRATSVSPSALVASWVIGDKGLDAHEVASRSGGRPPQRMCYRGPSTAVHDLHSAKVLAEGSSMLPSQSSLERASSSVSGGGAGEMGSLEIEYRESKFLELPTHTAALNVERLTPEVALPAQDVADTGQDTIGDSEIPGRWEVE